MAVAAPLVAPSPNTGNQAQAHLFVAQGLAAMQKAVPLLDPTSPLGQAVLETLKRLGKEVGSPPPETQASSLFGQYQDARRMAMQRLAMQNMAAKAPGGAAIGAPTPSPAGAPPVAAAPPAPVAA